MANTIQIVVEGVDKASNVLGGIGKSVGLLAGGALALGAAGVSAFAGVAVAAANMTSDINDATNNLQAELGLTRGEAEELGEVATAVWGNNFGANIQEAAGVVTLLRQQLGDLSNDELQDAAENAFRLSDVFETDVNESIDAAAVLMDEFGLSQQEAFDLMATGLQSGLNSSDDFLDSIREYGNVFEDAGFSAEQMYSIMETGAAGGVLGTDKIADAVKEMTVRLNEGGDDVAEVFDLIGFDLEQVQGFVRAGDEAWADYFPNIVQGINSIEDPIERQKAQVAIFGTMAEDLGASFTEGLSAATTSLEDMGGATDSLDIKYNNLSDIIEGVKRSFLLAFQPMGETILAIANEYLPPLLGAIQGFMGNLQEGMAPLDAFIEAIWDIAPQPVLDALINFRDNILPGLTEAFELVKGVIVDALIPALGTLLTAALSYLATVWTSILQPAITAVWTWLSNTFIPFLQNTVFPWLQTHIPQAIQTLKDFWDNVLLPAIQAVWDWMSTTLIPFFQNTVFPWLQEKIPEALQTLSDFWTETLLPAIEDVWKFLTEDMEPIWTKLEELLGVLVPLALEALQGTWQTLMEKLTEFWNDTLEPIYEFIRDKIIKIFNDWSEGVGGVQGAIESVTGWIDGLIEKLSNLELPEWMQTHSPSPWETGLWGVSNAMKSVNEEMVKMGNIQKGLPDMGIMPIGGGDSPGIIGKRPGSTGADLLEMIGNIYGTGGPDVKVFNLNVTSANSQGVTNDFAMMQAIAGGV